MSESNPDSTSNLASIEANVFPAEPNNPSDRIHRISYQGTGLSYALIALKTACLTVLTLGIYQFWGRTELRKYLWAQTVLDGHAFRYTGTGKELFIGAMKLAGVYIAFVVYTFIAAYLLGKYVALATVPLSLFFALVFPALAYFVRRYRFSRTTYRNIRFGMRPCFKEALKVSAKGMALSYITLGLYLPVFRNELHRLLTNNSVYGSLKFDYTGEDKEAWKISITGFFLTVITFGIYFPFYHAAMKRFRTQNTTIGGVPLDCDIKGSQVLVLTLASIVFIPLTLGFAAPWIMTELLKLELGSVYLKGNVNFAEVTQKAQEGNAAWDIAGDAFDIAIDL